MGLMDRFKRRPQATHERPEGIRVADGAASAGSVLSAVTGRLVAMRDIPDPVFASGALGVCAGVWPEEDVVFAMEAIQDPVSLFEPVYNDGGDAIYIIDQVKDQKQSDALWLENLAVSEALRRLNEREQKILRLRFFEGRTQMEVAGEIGISQAQVSRLEKNALQHMRKYVDESK